MWLHNKMTFNSKNDTIFKMMGPREGPTGRHCLPQTPTWSHDQSFHTTIEQTACGEGDWFTDIPPTPTSRHFLPTVVMPLIYFG
jgi:hypothetical protein